MEDYEKLLDRALESVPRVVLESSRFQIPTADVVAAGNQTVIRNFKSLSGELNRPPEHMAKYLWRELGVAGTLKENQLFLQGKFTSEAVNERVKRYVEEFVLCKECKKPDTKLEKIGAAIVLRCEACGARAPVRSV
ncbi:MAG: translation initiation factor IF-2 subunit beta [Candidatus Hadarchaeales archaeon]